MSRLLTVGITTRNRPESLTACLASMRLIAHLDPEVLVFDDRSQPPANGAASVARIIREAASLGTAAGRNRLVSEASCEFLLLMDDDARLIDARSVDEGVGVLRADDTVGAVAFAQAEADGRPWPLAMQPSVAQGPSLVPSFIGFAHMVRRDRFLAIGGYRELFEFQGEEKEFCLRLLEAGLHTVYLPHALVAHVVDPNSRDRKRYLRFVARNDCLNSLLNDPLTRLAWMLPARYVLYFRMRRGWEIRDSWGGLWLLRELASQLPGAWTARRPVSRGTLREWRALRVEPRVYRRPLQPDGVSGR